MLTLPNVPPYITAPRYDDSVVQMLQQDFIANLSWNERAYAIARIGVDSISKLTYPQIQSNSSSKDLFNIRPDNNCKSYCFFEVEQPYTVDTYAKEVKYFLSVIFWGNLTLIDNAKTYDFTSQLIQDVVKRLERKQCGEIKVEENPEKIFTRYTGLKQETNQYLMKKYTAFKINFTIVKGFENDCLTP